MSQRPSSQHTTRNPIPILKRTVGFGTDWLVVEAVGCEPLYGQNSLLTRKLTGNFVDSANITCVQVAITRHNQAIAAKFPIELSREMVCQNGKKKRLSKELESSRTLRRFLWRLFVPSPRPLTQFRHRPRWHGSQFTGGLGFSNANGTAFVIDSATWVVGAGHDSVDGKSALKLRYGNGETALLPTRQAASPRRQSCRSPRAIPE